MKKIMTVLAIALFVTLGLVPQEQDVDPTAAPPDLTKIERIQEKNDNITMVIEYIPATDEARFVYTCPSHVYDKEKAMNAIKLRATSFTRAKGYYFYTYRQSDSVKFDNEAKLTIYTSYVRFLR